MQPDSSAPTGWATWAEPLPAARQDAPALSVPQPVEQLQLTRDESDYCWYSTNIDLSAGGSGTLTLTAAADYVYIYRDGMLIAHGPDHLDENRSRTDDDLEALQQAIAMRYHGAPPSGNPHAFRHEFTLDLAAGSHELDILCCGVGLIKGDWQIGFENMVAEKKGLWGPVLWNGNPIGDQWHLRPFLAGERFGLYGPAAPLATWQAGPGIGSPLRWFRASFTRPAGDAPIALDLGSMGKGLAWVNGRCIGRYWLILGDQPHDPWFTGIVDSLNPGQPTQRYYHVPTAWLRDENEIILLEEQGGNPNGIVICRWK
jgi:hypothetical protein